MVCSSCGFENPGSMRFCGMCGTPLPHRPLTAPGAHSTLNFTRVPIEVGAGFGGRSTTTSSRLAVVPEIAGDEVPALTMTASTAVEEPVEELSSTTVAPTEEESVGTVEPPAQELVPDVPLDEYVHSFHYEPPSEPTEITMRGDAPVEEQRVVAETPAAAEPITADPGEDEATAPADGEAVEANAVAAPESVESRLGLEPESPAEAVAERPRFLDVVGPAAEAELPVSPSASGTSTIVGPSFLGLSDAPAAEAESSPIDDEEVVARKSHWRVWLAAAVVLTFVVLGVMEWRAQSNQTDNGPVEIIKAKVRNWKNSGQPQLADQPAESASADSNAKPDMQVQEQPKPQQQDQAANPAQNPNAGSSPLTSNPAAASPSAAPPTSMTAPKPVQSATAAPPKAPATQNGSAAGTAKSGRSSPSAPSKTQTTVQATATKPKPARPDQASDGGNDTAAAKSSGSGADELNKAKNASDSVAEAAWLWKSTAKGNPDAPVMLADMYMKGDGVPRSCEQAVVLLKTAAEKENARARNRLASMYATGNCVQRNRVEAYRWLSSALVANPHSDWAQQNKDLIWQQMTPDERTMAEKYR